MELPRLLQALRSDPGDVATRGVCSDWLEESGREEAGRTMRIRTELRSVVPGSKEWKILRHEEQQIIEAARAQFASLLGPNRQQHVRVFMEDGVPHGITTSARRLMYDPELLEDAVNIFHIRRVCITKLEPLLATTLAGPGDPFPRKIDELDVSGLQLTSDFTINRFLRSPVMPRLRYLGLHGCGLTREWLESLFSGDYSPLRNLRALDLSGNRLSPSAINDLLARRGLSNLEALDVSDNEDFPPFTVDTLLRAHQSLRNEDSVHGRACAPNLQELYINGAEQDLQRLAGAEFRTMKRVYVNQPAGPRVYLIPERQIVGPPFVDWGWKPGLRSEEHEATIGPILPT